MDVRHGGVHQSERGIRSRAAALARRSAIGRRLGCRTWIRRWAHSPRYAIVAGHPPIRSAAHDRPDVRSSGLQSATATSADASLSRAVAAYDGAEKLALDGSKLALKLSGRDC